ncbi:MAG TPA: nitroreductase [Paracoccaceae bacterium]|nr:nitroreductase [Paracoccaceae bacterium]
MPEPRPEVMEFLLTRRSRPAKTLRPPVPGREELRVLLEAAARSPDHGMLVPWRFIVIEGAALGRLAEAAAARALALGRDAGMVEKARVVFVEAPLVVAVVASPKPSEKIPEMEQLMSAGAVCLSLLNAALASGWGASWITGWMAYDRPFLEGLGLGPREFVAGFVHIGTEGSRPPERERPDIGAITLWIDT